MLERINELKDAVDKLGTAESDSRRFLRKIYEDLRSAQIQVFAGMFDELQHTTDHLRIRVVDCQRQLSVTVLPGAGGYSLSIGDASETVNSFATLWQKLRDALAEDIHAERCLQQQRAASARASAKAKQ